MSGFQVVLLKNGTPVLTFGSHTPFVAPSYSYEYTDMYPPLLSSITKTWTVKGRLYGTSSSDVATQWGAFTTALEAGQWDEVNLIKGVFPSGTLVDAVGGSSGFDFFKVEAVESPQTDGQWRGSMDFTVRLSGKKRLALVATGINIANVSSLDQTEEYAYGEDGLLTRTLSGTIEVTTGQASDTAKLFALKLPSASFGYVTNGPNGIEYEILNQGGTKARFRSVIRENHNFLPAGVGPSYQYSKSKSSEGGIETTVIRVTATGTGAADAVVSADPLDTVTRKVDINGRQAEAIYTSRVIVSGPSLVRTRTFSLRGGGKPVRFSRRTGGKDPVPHVLPRTEVEVIEQLRVEVFGSPGFDSFKIPASLEGSGIFEDTDAQEWDPILTRTTIGSTRSGDVWTMGLRRVYRAASVDAVKKAISDAATSLSSGDSTPSEELARKGGGEQ